MASNASGMLNNLEVLSEEIVDESFLWETHQQQKQAARVLTDEQEYSRTLYVTAISANDGESEIPTDMAMTIFQAPC